MIQGTSITRPARPLGLAFPIRAWRSFRTERTALRSGDGFARAYAENLSHRLPLLYCVMLFDTAELMASFYDVAPAILVLWLPLPFIALGCRRAAYWLPHKVMRRPLDVLSHDARILLWQADQGSRGVTRS